MGLQVGQACGVLSAELPYLQHRTIRAGATEQSRERIKGQGGYHLAGQGVSPRVQDSKQNKAAGLQVRLPPHPPPILKWLLNALGKEWGFISRPSPSQFELEELGNEPLSLALGD